MACIATTIVITDVAISLDAEDSLLTQTVLNKKNKIRYLSNICNSMGEIAKQALTSLLYEREGRALGITTSLEGHLFKRTF